MYVTNLGQRQHDRDETRPRQEKKSLINVQEGSDSIKNTNANATHLGGAGGPPADRLGGRGHGLSAEAPVLAAAVGERLGLQGFKGHGAHGLAGHGARTNRDGYNDGGLKTSVRTDGWSAGDRMRNVRGGQVDSGNGSVAGAVGFGRGKEEESKVISGER